MSIPAPAGNPGTDNNAPSEDDFARVRIVTVDNSTHLMLVGASLEVMVDPSTVSLHVFMSQEALNMFLKDADSRELIVRLETVDYELDEPTLEVDQDAQVHLRATNDEPEIVASDIFFAIKRGVRKMVSKIKSLREAASPTPPPARDRRSAGSVSCADC